MRLSALVLALLFVSHTAHADTIAGRASVIGGDTIEIHGEHIRILDIDAPESRQLCTRPDGPKWRCGQQAALALSDWIGQQTVTCESDKLDNYQRHLARCTVGGQDLGEWMAAQGWAVPDRDCKCEVIRDAAKGAQQTRRGIWLGSFDMPWDWRERLRVYQEPTELEYDAAWDFCRKDTLRQLKPPPETATFDNISLSPDEGALAIAVSFSIDVRSSAGVSTRNWASCSYSVDGASLVTMNRALRDLVLAQARNKAAKHRAPERW